jgi:Zn finger protein HypA/HybF involved in hydrogenase expression
MPKPLVVKVNQSIKETVKWISKLSIEGSRYPVIRSLAALFLKDQIPEQSVFNFAYDSIVYEPDLVDCEACSWTGFLTDVVDSCPRCASEHIVIRQGLRTVQNILRENRGNCTAYSILQASLLHAMGRKVSFRVVGFSNEGFEHIYIVSGRYVLDPCLGQKQDGTDTIDNRPLQGLFNSEVKYRIKKDYKLNRLEILQGSRARAVRTGLGSSVDRGHLSGSGFMGGIFKWSPKSKVGGFFADLVKQSVYPIHANLTQVTGRPIQKVEWSTKLGEYNAMLNVVAPQTLMHIVGRGFVNGATGGAADWAMDKWVRGPIWNTGQFAKGSTPGFFVKDMLNPDRVPPMLSPNGGGGRGNENTVKSDIGVLFPLLALAGVGYYLVNEQ